MYLFESEATFEADPATVWKVWTDVGRWPEWDVSKEIARLDGPFEPGVTGWAKQRGNLGGSFTITMVDAAAAGSRNARRPSESWSSTMWSNRSPGAGSGWSRRSTPRAHSLR